MGTLIAARVLSTCKRKVESFNCWNCLRTIIKYDMIGINKRPKHIISIVIVKLVEVIDMIEGLPGIAVGIFMK